MKLFFDKKSEKVQAEILKVWRKSKTQ